MSNKGLNNTGNTCYLNSALQMLLHNDDFCQTIRMNQLNSQNLNTMTNFINEYHTNPNSVITPHAVKKFVGNHNPIFAGNDQQDAAEFLIYLFETLNTNNILNPIFEIETETINKCKLRVCLKTTSIIEKNNMLMLPISEEDNTLDDCYLKFKEHERMEDRLCEPCNKITRSSKKIKISNWSNHLIIQLKRFQNNNSKINKSIEIPFEWRHGFKIKGAIIHSGSVSGGHYIYISKNDTNWTVCDDSNTYYITNEQAESRLAKAYIIYYAK
jgi:ubiquitin C-terminal hydrolase